MKTFKTMLFFAVITIFCSCENFDWFKTDKGLKKDIQGTWKREFLGAHVDFEEDWYFNEGKIIITREKNNTTDTIDEGHYTADAKMTVSYLKISGLSKDTLLQQYNNKWTIVQLDSKILYLATDDSGGGVLQREFEKK